MNSIVLASLLIGAGADVSVANPPDGSLIFCQNSKPVVEQFTKSNITHVAVVVHEDGECMVYEAAPPKVRRVHITHFYKEIGLKNRGRDAEDEVRVWMLPPDEAYTDEQVAKMRSYLQSQLGRRYSLRGWIREKPSDGIHCAELTADAVTETGRLRIDDGHNEDPSSLLKQLTPKYSRAHEVLITVDEDDEELKKTWCERTSEKWARFRKWCAWSCYETWTFCR